jgi:peptidoglycan/xylan/chitin deacetylase (PgdA/CDA1 family)
MQSLYSRVNIFIYFVITLQLFNFAVPGAFAQSTTPHDQFSGVILSYQRIGEDAFPSTSIRKEQFANHVKELAEGQYNVISLGNLIDSIKEHRPLPPNTIVITFDGGYQSAFDHAIPLLLDNKLPFTIFIATDLTDSKASKYIDWSLLKKLMKSPLVEIGLHPSSYSHPDLNDRQTLLRTVNKAKARFREETGETPEFFAYSFGEYSKEYKEIIKESGFKAAFGQHSGVVYSQHDLFDLPRFPMTDGYGDIQRFRLVARALPLPVTNIEPSDPKVDVTAPVIGFNIDPALSQEHELISCFISGQPRPKMNILSKTRIELRPQGSFEDDRVRVNCTMPAPGEDSTDEKRWRWFGMLLSVTSPDLKAKKEQAYTEAQ